MGLTINLDPGSYNIRYSISDSYYNTNEYNHNIKVNPLKDVKIVPITLKVSQHHPCHIKLTDVDGMPLSNETLIFTINGNSYFKNTDSNGVASLTINMNPTTKKLSLTYSQKSPYYLYKSFSVDFNLTVYSDTSNMYQLTTNYNYIARHSSFKVLLKNSNGNILSGKSVKFFANGNTYDRTTDNQGFASLNINLNSGLYGISAAYVDSNGWSELYKLIYVDDSNRMNDLYSGSHPLDYYIGYSTDYNSLNDGDFVNFASNLVTNCNDNLEKAVAIHNYVYNVFYKYYYIGIYNAKECLDLNVGNCHDQSNLAMSLAKSIGLATRGVGGDSMNGGDGHQWLQFYIDGHWIVSDPSFTKDFGQWSSEYNGNYYTNYKYSRALKFSGFYQPE